MTPQHSRGPKVAQARIAEYDADIIQYRQSLKAGADPAVVGPWIAETQAKKITAQAEAHTATGRPQMTRDEIAAIVTALGDLVQIVRDADPADKSKIYTQLGLTLTYQLRRRVVEATIKSGQNTCAEGQCPRGRVARYVHACDHG